MAGVDDQVLPAALKHYDCRNNRLAQMALELDGFATAVRETTRRVGRGRVGVFVGTTTEGCLESSVRSASYRDYYGTVADDLVFSPNAVLHEGSLRLMRHRYPVVPSATVLAAWSAR